MIRRIAYCLFFLCLVSKFAAQTPADSIALVHAPWKTSVLSDGIISKECSFDTLYGVPQHIAILEIHPDYKLDILVNSPMETTSVSARASGAVAAINGSFFNMQEGFSVCYLQQYGAVVDTTTLNYFNSEVAGGAMRFCNGKVELIPWDLEIEKKWKVDDCSVLVSGPLLLAGKKESDLSACNHSFVETRHPRSAMAVMPDGKILLMVVDGRFNGKGEGIRLNELAHLFRVLGAEDALNLDGGGSSALWCALAPENGVLNHPSDNKTFDHEGERKVANIICVYK